MSGSTQVSGISVPIFAVDHATAVINRVNKSIAGLGSQTSRWSQASSRAGGGAFGLNRLSEGMESLGVRTRDTFRALEKIAPAIGLITGATTLGGMLALELRFANLGQHVANLGQRLGIPVDRLTALQGAARLGGLGAEDMSAGLASLDESLRGATFRGDGQKIQAFNAIGVSFGEMGKQARTADDAIRDVANGIKWLNDTRGRGAALREAQNLGLEGLFPLLVKGAAGIDALEAKTKRLGGVMTPGMIERAKALREGFESVAIAAGGFANKLADAVSPQFTRMSEGFATWISSIAPGVSDWVGRLATRFGSWVTSPAFQENVWRPLNAGIERFACWVANLTEKDFSDFGRHLTDIADDVGRAASAAITFGDTLSHWQLSPKLQQTLDELKVIFHDIPYHAGKKFREFFGLPSDFEDPNTPEPPSGTDRLLRYQSPSPYPSQAYPQPGTGSPITVPGAGSAAGSVMQQVHDFFAAKGVPEAHIAGILANVAAESTFDPVKLGDFDKSTGQYTSYGLFQEHGPRMDALRTRYGNTPSVADQLAFAWSEPEMRRALGQMQMTGASPGAIFSRDFEGPQGGTGEDIRRGQASGQFEGAVHVSLEVTAPTGSQVVANTRANGAVQMSTPPRVVVGMPSAGFQPTPMFTH